MREASIPESYFVSHDRGCLSGIDIFQRMIAVSGVRVKIPQIKKYMKAIEEMQIWHGDINSQKKQSGISGCVYVALGSVFLVGTILLIVKICSMI